MNVDLGCSVTATGLVTDPDGRWLLVHPTRGGAWQMPGGPVLPGETPSVACAREARDAIGLALVPSRMLIVAWTPPIRPDGRAGLSLIFDLGELHPARRVRLARQYRDWCWATSDQAAHLLHPLLTRRLRHLRELSVPTAIYVEHTNRSVSA
ncbi:MAG: NUDIX hydrolase [Sporichthyaceae bacterium]|nr:NUDIX hydrolase [Sporichthyaceae bacterium]